MRQRIVVTGVAGFISGHKKILSGLLKSLFVWCIAAAIFILLFRQYPPRQILQSASFVRTLPFVLYTLGYFFFIWFVDCWSCSRTFTRFGSPTSIRDFIPLRFASYLITVFHYGAAQGLLAYFFKKSKGIPFFKSTGLILFTSILDLYWTICLAFLGSFFSDMPFNSIPIAKIVQTVWGIATIILLTFAVLLKLPLRWRFFQWICSRDLFYAFRTARFSDYALVMLMRLPIHLAISSSLYFIAQTFGAYLPFSTSIALVPLVILIGTIPITPGGLGTMQLATVELFKDFLRGDALTHHLVSPQELLLAMSLLFAFSNYFLKALTGTLFWKKVPKEGAVTTQII